MGQPSLQPLVDMLDEPKTPRVVPLGASHQHTFPLHLAAVPLPCAEVGAHSYLLEVHLRQHSGLRLSWKYLAC